MFGWALALEGLRSLDELKHKGIMMGRMRSNQMARMGFYKVLFGG